MSRSSPDWEAYERLVARLMADQLPTAYCVTPNARVVGRITGRKRQLDVLIDLRHDSDNSRRLIVDAKKRSRKIDVTDVEALRGLMEDVGATHGYLVCPHGHTKAAERRAQTAVSIRLLPLDRLGDFDPSTWPQCLGSRCKGGRVFWDGYPEIAMALQTMPPAEDGAVTQLPFVHYVGKCDRCGTFHVKCLTCSQILSVPDDDDDYGHQCACRLPWFWLGSIEMDESGNRSAELHAVLGLGQVITVDRRSL